MGAFKNYSTLKYIYNFRSFFGVLVRDFMLNDHLKVSITYTSLFILNFEK